MAGWGFTTDDGDGTAGDQPRFTTIRGNRGREVGIVQLQSSMWFQAKTALTRIEGNIFFNGPRSGINFNDGESVSQSVLSDRSTCPLPRTHISVRFFLGFGGGNVVLNNLIFNQCRQSGDHGPINSWDRQPFLTDVPYGMDNLTYMPALTTINNNFIIANYGGSQGVDNDDGSTRYFIHSNFMYGEGLKQDYGGHDSVYINNVNVVHQYDGQNCFNTWPFHPMHQHNYSNNTCVMLYDKHYGSAGDCHAANISSGICRNVDPTSGDQCMLDLSNNRYYTPYGNASVSCNGAEVPLADLQAGGVELGSTVDVLPSNEQIIAWGKAILKQD